MYLKRNLNFDKLVTFTQHASNVCYSKNCISESLKYIHVRSNTLACEKQHSFIMKLL